MKVRIAMVLLLVSCGSRTGLSSLFSDGDGGSANGDDGGGLADASGGDTGVPGDDGSVSGDAGIDVAPFDADRRGCAPSATPIYVVTVETSALYSFDPPSAKFTRIGPLRCPGESMSHPKSMAVNRAGTAFVLFEDGNIYAASTTNAACSATSYHSQSPAFVTFGMGFSSNGGTSSETLFLAGNATGVGRQHATQLGTLDSNFVLHVVGSFDQSLPNMELTGNAAGSLFGFYPPITADPNSVIVQLDKRSAGVIGRTVLEGVVGSYAFAFSFWGDSFYIFTSPKAGAGSNVTRFRPSDGTITDVGSLQETIIGAGVSTCAPD